MIWPLSNHCVPDPNFIKVQEKLILWVSGRCCHITFDNRAFPDYIKLKVKILTLMKEKKRLN